MKNRIQQILDLAVRAPSGDNCQPWRVEFNGEELRLFNVPEIDSSEFNRYQRASMVAHGALLENILICSSGLNLKAIPTLQPNPADPDLIASFRFEDCASPQDAHFEAVSKRCTNRKTYQKISLTCSEREALLACASRHAGWGTLNLVENEPGKTTLAKILATNDQGIFEHQLLHRFLFKHIRWTEEETLRTRDGIDIRTLELSSMDRLSFRLLKFWPLVYLLRKVGALNIVGLKAKQVALSASAIGVISLDNTESADWIQAGRLMQRIWLEAARLRLSFQLMTGITFLMQGALENSISFLSEHQRKALQKSHEQILRTVGHPPGNRVVILFRVGHSAEPTATAVRKPIVLKEFS
ncbi:MAG TPA: nitroreductase [Bdellovibrionales bacterium]|nr:MAG: hypothetical protein A2Z97_07550 [Bdellovibrionales bacterium GWB1_52_6]OFZ04735.1 MAG: hypothetical protein A2X97_13495 [Bdellovibrionales bacterium GWA1_52_35]OFZ36118.1 MAG: hypothetical protein A2070_11585 [Bdellovibrionales bacterium GWC1_52_8]HAR41942.1 nitroreductase [Bdellovibrionales bacterium]HCM39548.1 nitroreductase [Bdellovibrionales bacterium]